MSNKAEEGQMYSTGEIARLCQVSVRTVQYYDQRGILSRASLVRAAGECIQKRMLINSIC